MTAAVLAYLGLGANLGDAPATLRSAIAALSQLPDTKIEAQSAFYVSAPVDASGPDFVNAVVAVSTEFEACALLKACQDIEDRFGRARPYRNAPRTLDIDLLLYGNMQFEAPALTLPHPRMHERAFVLAPLHEIAPGLSIPGHGLVSDCLAGLAAQRIEKLTA